MEVLGGVTAVFATIEFAAEVAKVLNLYITEVYEAKEEVLNLCSAIDSTVGLVRDVTDLIQKNENTKRWNDNGVKRAQKCVTDCEKIVKKLQKLLQKSSSSADIQTLDPKQIDLSKIERAKWPILKPRFKTCTAELQAVKAEIMLAMQLYAIATVYVLNTSCDVISLLGVPRS